MFDISLGKLLLIGVVALVVLGPERLPIVARMLGALIARAQRFVMSVKADLQQQLPLESLGQLRQDMHETASLFQTQLAAEAHYLQGEITGAQTLLSNPATSAEELTPHPLLSQHSELATEADANTDASSEFNEKQLDLFTDLPSPNRVTALEPSSAHPHQ